MSTEYMIYFPLVLLDWILISQLLMLAVNAAVTMFKDYTNNKLGRFNGLFIFTFVFGAMRFFLSGSLSTTKLILGSLLSCLAYLTIISEFEINCLLYYYIGIPQIHRFMTKTKRLFQIQLYKPRLPYPTF